MTGKKRHIFPIVATLTLLVGLLVIQFIWIWQAAEMKEKQFSKSVDLALYRISENISKDQQVCSNIYSCFNENHNEVSFIDFENGHYWELLDSIIREDLLYYDIQLDYDFDIIQLAELETDDRHTRNCYLQCLDQDIQRSGLFLSIQFPGKWKFVIAQIGPVFIISVILIILITALIVSTLVNYFRVKSLSENTRNFIDNMIHEFKTPLSNISFANSRIRKNVINTENQSLDKYIEIIENETEKLNDQVNDFLESTFAPHNADINFTNIDLHEIIESSLTSLEGEINKNKGIVTTKLMAENSVIYGNRQQLINVVGNIIDNALKYCSDRPDIVISTRNDTSNILLRIKDNGLGISQTNMRYVFDKYYRVPTGDIHNVKGYGLGLFYVKNVVRVLHGSIKINSELNKGTEVIIKFPVVRTS